MERVKALIYKLHEQARQNADTSALLETVEQLQAVLKGAAPAQRQYTGTAKVAVVFPSGNRMNQSTPEIDLPVTIAEVPVITESTALAIATPISEPVAEVEKSNTFIPPPPAPVLNGNGSRKEEREQSGWLFDPVHETPTLAHQQHQGRDLNDIIGNRSISLNETLKSGKTELAEVLTDAPIRDLKKGIGINDRYVFISELFRGDEAMYERSIKTINNLRILPEAQYWIERELKVKLGWDDGKTTTQHFYQLVRRRFS
ncbi:MAG: hypothetical protein H7Y27_15860 [Gemmatimonadaceae bacterium]|nr:hypothetical protein [Chitinophagaceae bacterium]